MANRVLNTVMLPAADYEELLTYKEFCFELCQLYCCTRGTGKSAKDAIAGLKAAEKALAGGLDENGLPPLKKLRDWYVARHHKKAIKR